MRGEVWRERWGEEGYERREVRTELGREDEEGRWGGGWVRERKR